MKKMIYFLMLFFLTTFKSQVGINTTSPETTLDVVGKPNDATHFDGIIAPRILGDQLALKNYSASKKGAIVFVTSKPANQTGQVANIVENGYYYFDGNLWQPFSKEIQPTEYRIIVSFDEKSTNTLTATSNWSPILNYSGNANAYLTSLKTYILGTKNYGGLKGTVLFRKIQGIVNVWFQIYRSYDSAPITGNAFISIPNIFSELGYIPNQIILLHAENSTQFFPALLENYAIQIPQNSLNAMSTSYYTYGEIQGYSNWIKPN